MKRKTKKKMWITLAIIAVLVFGVVLFLNLPRFGSLPDGESLTRMEASPNYRDGTFHNLQPTQQLTGENESFFAALRGFLFDRPARVRPAEPLPVVATDLHSLDKDKDLLVWFGHSSVFLQAGGIRFLIDPVFSKAASPVPFVNRAFDLTYSYRPEDMPDIDYLLISHDHWDHLDYPTVKALKARTSKVVCPLGAGAHFRRWGFDADDVIEMDWDGEIALGPGSMLYCLPARHFSGRSLRPNRSLWASYMIVTPGRKIFIGGDSGYGEHFAAIGNRFGPVDLAILENGQYNEGWKYIHMLPEQLPAAAADVKAKSVIPVHNSKFALSKHSWDEPLSKVSEAHDPEAFRLLTPIMGEAVDLGDTTRIFGKWWEGIK